MSVKISALGLAHETGTVNVIISISWVRKQTTREVKLLGSVNVKVRLQFQRVGLWSQHAFKQAPNLVPGT